MIAHITNGKFTENPTCGLWVAGVGSAPTGFYYFANEQWHGPYETRLAAQVAAKTGGCRHEH